MIKQMRKRMIRLGYAPDWTFEYRTMDREYHKKIQLALLNLHRMGRIYRAKHPVYWCPKCKTTLAQAELGYIATKGLMAYLKFETEEGNYVEIATTRPELLHACVAVAVHPKDEKYKNLKGKTVKVPLYPRKVPIIIDEAVDPKFGTGAVMICTFGDEQDVKWVLKHNLPIIEALDEDGKLVNSGKYDGLHVNEARNAILTDLKSHDALCRVEEISHNVLAHTERSTCGAPIEFLPKKQWFIKIIDLKEKIIELAQNLQWFPSHYLQRLIDWVEGLEWDWIFSRQRIFGTPIPFWYCNNCDYIIAPEKLQLPVQPTRDSTPLKKCPTCGSENINGATEVCDCWIDSSITPLIIAGWPDNLQFYPLSLRQQGSEIIRTWAFYSLTQCFLQTTQIPFKTILVNGMILGPNGKAMSSSLGNIIDPLEVIEKHGADALRQALLLASLGSDFSFKWKDVQYCQSFLQKLWSVARFAQQHLKDYKSPKRVPKLHVVDAWILSRLQSLIKSITEAMEKFQFNLVIQKYQNFVWHEFCDHYIEFAKYRLYASKKKWMKKSAQYALNETLLTLIQLYAPIAPHITEEIYQQLFKKHKHETLHSTAWPQFQQKLINKKAEDTVKILGKVISAVRRFKSQHGLSLSEKIPSIIICYPREKNVAQVLQSLRMDIKEIGKIERITIKESISAKPRDLNIKFPTTTKEQ